MDLIDVKRTEADKKREREQWDKPMMADMEDYPYGLQIQLDNETIVKLGLGDIDTADEVDIVACGVIVSDNINTVGGKTRRSMTIQLQKLAISQEEESESLVKTLYGGS